MLTTLKNVFPFLKGYQPHFTKKNISSFTNIPPERIHVKGEWEVAISETSNPFLLD